MEQYWSATQVTIFQWVQPWYGAGKTSTNSRFNIPGKIAWITMETPGLLTLLYVMKTLPAQVGMAQIPWENKVMAGLYVSVSSLQKNIFFAWSKTWPNVDNPLPLPGNPLPYHCTFYVPNSSPGMAAGSEFPGHQRTFHRILAGRAWTNLPPRLAKLWQHLQSRRPNRIRHVPLGIRLDGKRLPWWRAPWNSASSSKEPRSSIQRSRAEYGEG